METKHVILQVGHSKRYEIPAGLKVIPASNLPESSRIKYWLDEIPIKYQDDEIFKSIFRNEGFGLFESEVETGKTWLDGSTVEGHEENLFDEIFCCR